jgi:hypothetical protein
LRSTESFDHVEVGVGEEVGGSRGFFVQAPILEPGTFRVQAESLTLLGMILAYWSSRAQDGHGLGFIVLTALDLEIPAASLNGSSSMLFYIPT